MARSTLRAGRLRRLDDLIASGQLSDCEIGRRLRLSHTAVWRRRQLLMERPGQENELVRTTLAADENYVPGPSGKFRCPGCGGHINVLPCRLCRCRRQLASNRAARLLSMVGTDGPPEHRAKVKQRQLAFGEASGASDGPGLVEGANMPAIAGPGSALVKHYQGKLRAGRAAV